MANKEMINENELLELANRYIQLEKEHEDYVYVTYQLITNLQNQLNELKKQIK
jgi:hypothetical protein